MTEWPVRGQQAPNFWDDVLKTYIDEAPDAAETAAAAAQADADAAAAAAAAHSALTNNPHTVTKSQVGLGNADNTSDANKPVSTATATALGLKADLASPAFTGNPTAPTPATTDNDTSVATSAFVKAASGPLIAQGVELREAFTDMADGAPSAVAATRQAMTNFQFYAGAAPYVRSGFLSTTTPASAQAGSYRIAQLTGPVIRVGARFAFTTYSNAGGLLALSIQATSISTKSEGQVPVAPMHFVISPTGWSIDVNDTDNTGVETIASGSFLTPLTADGAALHTVDVVLDRDRQKCYITFPDGRTLEFSDSRFALPGTFVYVEPFKSAGSLSTKTDALIKEWWADARGVEILPLMRGRAETLPVQPTLLLSWAHAGGNPVQFSRRGQKGILSGQMSGGTSGGTIFTLPGPTAIDPGYRPRRDRHYAVAADSAFGDLLILANGAVVYVAGSNTWVDFEIEWDIALL